MQTPHKAVFNLRNMTEKYLMFKLPQQDGLLRVGPSRMVRSDVALEAIFYSIVGHLFIDQLGAQPSQIIKSSCVP
jgi:hypothetical protein